MNTIPRSGFARTVSDDADYYGLDVSSIMDRASGFCGLYAAIDGQLKQPTNTLMAI
jgi:hypothetical protein